MNPRLYITGEINAETYFAVSKFLRKASKSPGWVDIVVDSDGGNAYQALAIYDCIQGYLGVLDVAVYATGLVASAATLILVAGTTSCMTQNAWVMVHEDTTTATETDKVSDIEQAAKHARALENQWNALLARHTKLTADEWTEINKRDTYLTAAQCLEYGLVDEVL